MLYSELSAVWHILQGTLQYRGPLDVVKQVLKSEGGVRGLYKGMGPTLLREVPGSAALFAAYEALKLSLAKQQVGLLTNLCQLPAQAFQTGSCTLHYAFNDQHNACILRLPP